MIDPSANTIGYRLIKSFPDNRLGLRSMHILALMSKRSKPSGLDVRTINVKRRSGNGQVAAYVVRPKQVEDPLPVVLHLHGGGYAIGAPFQDYDLMRRYIEHTPCIFVAPQYRRSFQAPYPAGLQDCYDTLIWLKDNIATIGGRDDQIFVMGESGGGGLTAALCLLARDRGEVNIACQIPFYGMLDDRHENLTACDPSLVTWSQEKNRLAWELYLSDVISADNVVPDFAAPARAKDLSRLPPAIGLVGDQDLFHDENISYFDRLKAANVPADIRVIPGGYHAVEAIAPTSNAGKSAWEYLLKSFAGAAKSYFAEQPQVDG